MKRVRFAVAIATALLPLLLGGCALIPPIAIGRDALGFTERTLTVPLNRTTEATVEAPSQAFADIKRPSFPIAPRSFRSVQGFRNGVWVDAPLTPLPDTIALSGTLGFTVSDRSGAPEPVSATVDFGPLELKRSTDCGEGCNYVFSDPEAAARALTFTVAGEEFRRMLRTITEGEENMVDVTLSVRTDFAALAITLTVEVIENYIDF
ncbi:MAG TPA: hypothetical protein VF168_12320 [Trueperaceae bacterium]